MPTKPTAPSRVDLTGLTDPRLAFAQFYAAVDATVAAQAPDYRLPLNLDDTYNGAVVADPHARAMLRNNGFVVIDHHHSDNIGDFYQRLCDFEELPCVTVDTPLHLYHLQFDQMLGSIEQRQLAPQLLQFTRGMLERSQQRLADAGGGAADDKELGEAARRNVAYFAVALGCLQPATQMPSATPEEARAERKLIDAHAGFARSPIFGYKEDYSQYVPRGHYTRSEALQRYFRAMTWYGRMGMLLDGEARGGLVTDREARIQTLQAALVTGDLYCTGARDLRKLWERIYRVTAFFAGLADDLTPYDYAGSVAKVAASAGSWPGAITTEEARKLQAKLSALPAPRIYGGTDRVVLASPAGEEDLAKLLQATRGMRLMGQRFAVDAYVIQHLLTPVAGSYTGHGEPFTLRTEKDGGSSTQRGLARGLDVMAALGSERAYAILKAEGDTQYQNYDEQLARMRRGLAAMPAKQRCGSLQGGWLHALQPLLTDLGRGYPAFMRTPAYRDRALWAALGSWTELKHDTVLYSKQPFGPAECASAGEPEAPPPGYVEPVPELYGRLLSLVRMTRKGLASLEAIDPEALQRLDALEQLAANLLRISAIELRGEALSARDADYLSHIVSAVENCIPPGEGGTSTVPGNAVSTALVADVVTDSHSGKCVQEAVGYLKEMIVAYRVPDGRIAIGKGPVLSHYEFKHPVSDRLTDEKWRDEVLAKKPPAAPKWTRSFYVGK